MLAMENGTDQNRGTSPLMMSVVGSIESDEKPGLERKVQQHPSAASLTWTNLSITVSGRGSSPSHEILQDCTGYAEAGSITAIMGPSGSGKSTLLDALAGRLGPNTMQTGNILLNGESKSTLSYGIAGYVTQEDVLIGTLTVKESIQYSASLRLPDRTSRAEQKKIVESAIVDMGLYECQNTAVGNFFVRGLSGGEKRRLSIALQILTRPRVLFLDEPTSGLDSAAAYFVVQTLKNLAKDGRTLISAIHQPSSEVFELFDSLILLSSGQTIFFGDRASAPQHFASAGFPCPPLRNPSDHYLHTINADFDRVKYTLKSLSKGARDVEFGNPSIMSGSNTKQVVKRLVEAYQNSEYAVATISKIKQITSNIGEQKTTLTEGSRSQASFMKQIVTLTRRSFVNMIRDIGYYWLRLAMYFMVAICLGTIFWNVGLHYNSILARSGCMFFVAAFLTFMAIGGFPSFVEDMKVFRHERLNGHYGVVAFVIGNTLSSLPFLFLISLVSGTIVYFMVHLHPGFNHYAYFVLMLFASLTCVESLMMAVSSVVGANFLAGIVIGAGIQAIYMLVAGYFRLIMDVPKPVWRYPISYIAFHTYAIQGLFKNDFPGLSFENFLSNGVPIGPNLSGTYVVEQIYGIQNSWGRWTDFGIVVAMIIIYRILFFIFIKLNEKYGQRVLALVAQYRNGKSMAHKDLTSEESSTKFA